MVISTILEPLNLSLFVQGLGDNPLTVGGSHSSSDLDSNEHTGFTLISLFGEGEVVLLVGSFSGLSSGPTGHFSGSALTTPLGWQQADLPSFSFSSLAHVGLLGLG